MYLKRQNIGKFWPVPRKGKKYLAVASHEKERGIPLVVVARDILKVVKNKKELKKLLTEKAVMINEKIVRDTNYPLVLFDSLSFPHAKKSYRVILTGKKIGMEEITEKAASVKICKIVGKKILNGNKIQLNLSNGRNILSSEKAEIGDFLLLDLKNNKIQKVIQLQKGTKIIVICGKNKGIQGKIKEIIMKDKKKIAEISTEKRTEKIEIKNIFVLE